MNFSGVIVAVASLFIMGIYHPIVIKTEYYFSARCWPFFAALGVVCLVASLFLSGAAGAIVAFLGAVNLWCIVELKQQAERVRKGWFPRNPKRRY